MNITITDSIKYIGVDDTDIDLFESQYVVPEGVSYNSYLILDEKVTLMDTVDFRKMAQWEENLIKALDGRTLDYLVISHLEPDHAGSIGRVVELFPSVTLVGNAKTFQMLPQFFESGMEKVEKLTVKEGDSLELGTHSLHFYMAPMVHWPEVMVSYESSEKILFSADGFGKFGALSLTENEDWACEARRYYFNIVGKYGAPVQILLKKAAGLNISMICPLHGPILKENLGYYINLYDIWSSYRVESEGIVIAYTSVYGNTKAAVELLAEKLKEKGCPKVVVNDLARCDMAEAVEDAFRYGKLVLATTTYNAEIFPFMREFIHHLTERGYKKRIVAMMENGSWAPQAIKVMRAMLDGSKELTYTENNVRIMSALNAESREQIEKMADELCSEYMARQSTADKNDLTALFRIGYGLYVVTSNDGKKDNGLIVNTVTQVTNTPNRIAVTINKDNYSHHVIKQTGIMNINCLDTTAPFAIFERFGFQSGRTADKFDGIETLRSDNALRFLPRHINALMSLKVEQYVDLDTHGMFICSITEARVMGNSATMSYTYYQDNVKPKPKTEGKKGYVCKICGWVYEGETLPEDIVCPLCKHGAADFEPIQ